MPLWDKVKQELDRAGQVAQDALDEGRIRLEAHRARQMADKAAEALGYAVYRARQGGGEILQAGIVPAQEEAVGLRRVAQSGENRVGIREVERGVADCARRFGKRFARHRHGFNRADGVGQERVIGREPLARDPPPHGAGLAPAAIGQGPLVVGPARLARGLGVAKNKKRRHPL